MCSHASEELPSNLDYMLRETYNWFNRSALRRKSYSDIYKIINDGEDPLQLIQLSATRWLARGKCVERILDQWESLKLQFDIAATEAQDRYVAKELQKMYSDLINLLFFNFLKPILSEFNALNVLFQKEQADHLLILQELERFTLSMLGRVLHPLAVKLSVDLNFKSILLPIERVDFGYQFSILLKTMIETKKITESAAHHLKTRCQSFLIGACKELLKRTAGNSEILSRIKILSPTICLKPSRPPFNELPFHLINDCDIPVIEKQWRILLNVDFAAEFEGSVPTAGAIFWARVIEMTNVEGEFIFKELAMLALSIYSLPISNATVERVFSQVTLTKTKLRNRMGLDLLSSILRIKMSLQEDKICCTGFEPKANMLKYNSSIYETNKSAEEIQVEEDLLNALND